ncbi:MAG: FliM/FliN family flagellar motor switch protein [Bryobacterales bacterium]|nr:FliM/FliN family flagellar motor switch protein [Bryobacterales bacterium]
MDPELSQQEIDSLFRGAQPHPDETAEQPKALPFDFSRLDRIPKSQLRAIRLVQDNFVRSLASSLSAYLRTSLSVTLVSVEQLSYAEFLDGLASPTCLARLGLSPFEGNAVLELNPNLTFPVLESLLGGKNRTSGALSREITEIERNLLEGLLSIILKDLRDSWAAITAINFVVESVETEPQLLHVLNPGEAFVATGIEIRTGGVIGMMNLAIPSLIIKQMRGKFDQPGGRRSRSSDADQARVLNLVRNGRLGLEVRLRGPRLPLSDVVALEPGDLIPLDFPLARPLDCLVNGSLKFRGQVVSAGHKRAFLVEETGCRAD